VPDGVSQYCVAIPPNDLNLLETTLKNDPQIGAVILEPTGGHWGAVPIRGDFLSGLREITTRLGRVLIFDEVITGFRVSPGGAQAHYGVTPDLTAMAKILAGGLPGGCLAGKQDILAFIEPRPGKPKMKHPGTYNANPLSASAGVATLNQVLTGEPCQKANLAGLRLRNKLNAMLAANKFPWAAYGDFSMVRVVRNESGSWPMPASGNDNGFIPHGGDLNKLDGPKDINTIYAMRQAMLLEGIDFWGFAGMTSAEHSAADIEKTVRAMEKAIGQIG
jgi:glutamate-1-semialdehyde 2,1-aminomutase